ncbi:TetR/AcrR family transcriptional regulator [Sedimentitalea sp. XS_ASV28]|uniref:TetR/AcrR family transcriptional regulator n=1 Tax=Sedimentitalea sp. XS_ASV28 TaxID=3241296 RepID=UPI003512F194
MMHDSNVSKRDAILRSALQAFSTYGFRKTSMNDIADGAGMSRAAVYQHYRNKDDIFRSLTQMYYDNAAGDLATALSAEKTVPELLQDAFETQIGDMIETLVKSPHGMELLDTGEKTTATIKQTGEDRLRDIYMQWLERTAAEGRITLPDTPEQVADVIMVGLKGLKTTANSVSQLRARLAIFATLIAGGLMAG